MGALEPNGADAGLGGSERVKGADTMRAISTVRVIGSASLSLTWADGAAAELDLKAILTDPAFAALQDPAAFAAVTIGEWGHSLTWPSGCAIGADRLWLETLSANGHWDTRAFLEWRLRHSLSRDKAAEAIGIPRQAVAQYTNGEKRVPKTILLACRGWEAGRAKPT